MSKYLGAAEWQWGPSEKTLHFWNAKIWLILQKHIYIFAAQQLQIWNINMLAWQKQRTEIIFKVILLRVIGLTDKKKKHASNMLIHGSNVLNHVSNMLIYGSNVLKHVDSQLNYVSNMLIYNNNVLKQCIILNTCSMLNYDTNMLIHTSNVLTC